MRRKEHPYIATPTCPLRVAEAFEAWIEVYTGKDATKSERRTYTIRKRKLHALLDQHNMKPADLWQHIEKY